MDKQREHNDLYQSLFEYYGKSVKLTRDDTAFIVSLFKPIHLKRRAFLVVPGDVCQNHFIVKGGLKLYLEDENARQHCQHFGFEQWWMGDMNSFLNQEPSRLHIQALEPTTVLQITLEDQHRLLEAIPALNTLYRQLVEKALSRANQRILDTISSCAEDRYEDFLATYPSYVERITNQDIASYIGVTPEFFSKMKRDYWKKASQ
ncbi:MAG: Crp/Fnr family transcriptional regulator [Balneolaceae bacterium]|nr:Crp/Fnr family transcriptional regulator [Balneolaceae bacterium]